MVSVSGCVRVIYDPVMLQVTACLLSGTVGHMIKPCHLIYWSLNMHFQIEDHKGETSCSENSSVLHILKFY